MAKGAQGERDVARDLSLWWTDHQRDDTIWRTSGSGARFTTRQKTGQKTANSAGDFAFIDPVAKPLFDLLVIENKVGYTNQIDPLSAVDSKKADILETWLKKAYIECHQTNRHFPLLVFKRNRKNRCVMMPFRLYSVIAQRKTMVFPRIVLFPQKTVIMGFDQFLNWCTPDIIRDILKEASK
jgi:hypothetical protein